MGLCTSKRNNSDASLYPVQVKPQGQLTEGEENKPETEGQAIDSQSISSIEGDAKDKLISSEKDTATTSEDITSSTEPLDPAAYGYKVVREIGRGGFSVVYEAENISTGQRVALKRVKKTHLEAVDLKHLRRETSILRELSHPNIIKLYDVFENDNEIHFIMELVSDGLDLFDRICERGQFSEKDAATVIGQIVRGVQYLHSHGIVHRDLKPENLLTERHGKDDIIKLCDFGFAKKWDNSQLKTACGSPGYVAPEILTKDTHDNYDHSVDMWSVGVILFILLGGYPPFNGSNPMQIFKRTMDCQWGFNDKIWNNVSESAKDLISHLLVRDPTQRYTAKQFLEHTWLQTWESAPRMDSPTDSDKIEKFQEFNSSRKLNLDRWNST